MQVQMSFQHAKASQEMKERIEELSGRLAKYFKGNITADWHFTREGKRCTAKLHVTGNQMDYFAEGHDDDENFYAAMDECLEKMERQIRKRKETVKDRLHRSHRAA